MSDEIEPPAEVVEAVDRPGSVRQGEELDVRALEAFLLPGTARWRWSSSRAATPT